MGSEMCIRDRPPFKVCFGHGLVLGEDGREMHKSWGNAIDFDDAAETMGADVMRWMYCTRRPETNLPFGYTRANEVKRRFLIPLWNVYSFFTTYANLDKWTPRSMVNFDSLSLLDRWILSKLNVLVKYVTERLEDFDPYDAAIAIERFVEDLSTWFVRRSRRRFWKSEKDEDKNAAYTTLYTCLTTLVKLLAPFIPFTTEEIYQNLVRNVDPKAPESVHHNSWPKPNEELIDEDLMTDMDLAIKVCELGRSARSRSGIKLRQPLLRVIIVADEKTLERIGKLKDLIMEELNVKDLRLSTEKEEILKYAIKLRPQILGRKYGKLLPRIQKTIEEMDVKTLAELFKSGKSVTVKINGEEIDLLPEEVEVLTNPKEEYAIAEEDGLLVAVDTRITEALRKEGFARDIVRRIQNQRKEAGFKIADWIETYYETGPELSAVFEEFEEYIANETLSKVIRKSKPPKNAHVATYEIGGETLKIGLIRVET